MINIKLTDILETGTQYTKNLPLAISIGSLFLYIIYGILPFNFYNVPSLLLPSATGPSLLNDTWGPAAVNIFNNNPYLLLLRRNNN